MPRTLTRLSFRGVQPRLEPLEDRSVPSVSPLDMNLAHNLRNASPHQAGPDEVEQTLERLYQASEGRPGLQEDLADLTPKQTIVLATKLANADSILNMGQLRNLIERVEDAIPEPEREVELSDPLPDRMPQQDQTPAAPSAPAFDLSQDSLRSASQRLDFSALTVSVSALPGSPVAAAQADSSAVFPATAAEGQNLSVTPAAGKDEAPSVTAAVARTGVRPGSAVLAVPVSFDETALATVAGEVEGQPINATPSSEMLEATLAMEGNALEALAAQLDRMGQALGLPPGAGMPAWMLTAALALAACELARRQLRAARHSPALSPSDAADTLSWSLTQR